MILNELRIGNWITDLDFLNNTREIQVQHLDLKAELSAKPILLTKEWLVRLGLELKKETEVGHNEVYYNSKDDMFMYVIDYHYDDYGYLNHTEKHVEYVHQLQNLNFALVGEELDTKT